MSKEAKKLTKKQKFSKEMKSFAWVVFFVLIFRSTLYEPFKIPSGSMIPTLLIGDFILVSKLSYGLKVPFTEWVGERPIYIANESKPKRGDVVVFKFPNDTSVNYIKRVIGTPGDVIEMKNKRLYINGKEVPTKEIPGGTMLKDMDEKFKKYSLTFYEETLGENKHIYQIDQNNFFKADFDQLTVPKDHYFVMGDNRDFSYDSRYWGFVPHKYIKGKALFVWFSMIFPWNDHPTKFRPWRVGVKIN